jgi:hypothetical protein
MDWVYASHPMIFETELIFCTCLVLFIHKYFDRFIHWIHPSINVTKSILTPTVLTIVLSHRFSWFDASSTVEDHKMVLFQYICQAIITNLTMPRIFRWMDPSMDTTKEFFFAPFLALFLGFHNRMPPLSELDPFARKVMTHIMNGTIS